MGCRSHLPNGGAYIAIVRLIEIDRVMETVMKKHISKSYLLKIFRTKSPILPEYSGKYCREYSDNCPLFARTSVFNRPLPATTRWTLPRTPPHVVNGTPKYHRPPLRSGGGKSVGHSAGELKAAEGRFTSTHRTLRCPSRVPDKTMEKWKNSDKRHRRARPLKTHIGVGDRLFSLRYRHCSLTCYFYATPHKHGIEARMAIFGPTDLFGRHGGYYANKK